MRKLFGRYVSSMNCSNGFASLESRSAWIRRRSRDRAWSHGKTPGSGKPHTERFWGHRESAAGWFGSPRCRPLMLAARDVLRRGEAAVRVRPCIDVSSCRRCQRAGCKTPAATFYSAILREITKKAKGESLPQGRTRQIHSGKVTRSSSMTIAPQHPLGFSLGRRKSINGGHIREPSTRLQVEHHRRGPIQPTPPDRSDAHGFRPCSQR